MTQILTKQHSPYFWQFDQNCFSDMSENYFTPEYWQAKNAILGKESGRGTTWFIKHLEHELVLRHYLRGGMMRHLSRDSYIFNGYENTRAIAEFNILHILINKKLPVPKPAAAQITKHGLVYKADLLTHKIPNARDLVQILQSPQTTAFYQQLGKLLAVFHQQGVFHADLNIQNILYDNQGQFWLIDFDRARLLSPQKKWQEATLSRLKRSFEKERERFGIKWSDNDWQTIIKAYQASTDA